jgi:hypothetical protein
MSIPQFGKLIDGEAQRDAIHVATAPVVAAEQLSPGDHVGFVKPGDTSLVGASAEAIGIVDPFLRRSVRAGQRFWLFLYPNTVTSLQHQWTHPAFPTETRSASEQWLRDFAESPDIDLTYHALMAGAADFLEYGHYLCDGGKWEGVSVPEEFWDHYTNVTGKKLEEAGRLGHSFFTCSC